MPAQSENHLMFGLNDKPPVAIATLAAFQHLLAVFGGIITAPLIMARGMGLSVADTNYLLSSALFISGVATAIQIGRVGAFGSGLLSIQGTSFTFIGPILFAFFAMPESWSDQQKLAVIFGSAAVAATIMMPLCFYINRLRRIFTPAVTGTTIILIGMTLVWTTLKNLVREYTNYQESDAWMVVVLACTVFFVTLFLALSRNPWLRLGSIMAGLGAGFILALMLGEVNFSILSEIDATFFPEPLRYGVSFEWGVLLLLLPVFLVTATESVGDFTATSSFSREQTSGPKYWKRVRGGLMGDALNSFIAVLFSTFPNTTFSQNNGVIRLTGIASRFIGFIVAGMLILLGLFPVVGGLFQMIPSAVVYGATVLMFGMVILAGINIVQRASMIARTYTIVVISVLLGLVISAAARAVDFLPEQLQMLLAFPVSTGAIVAIVLELSLRRDISPVPGPVQP